MTALTTMKSALIEAKTEAASLRIRVRQLEEKLVEVAAAGEREMEGRALVGVCRVYRHGAGEQPKLPHPKQPNCVDWEALSPVAPVAAVRPADRCAGFEPHPLAIYAEEFCVAPVYDAKPGETARPHFCGQPHSAHGTETKR